MLAHPVIINPCRIGVCIAVPLPASGARPPAPLPVSGPRAAPPVARLLRRRRRCRPRAPPLPLLPERRRRRWRRWTGTERDGGMMCSPLFHSSISFIYPSNALHTREDHRLLYRFTEPGHRVFLPKIPAKKNRFLHLDKVCRRIAHFLWNVFLKVSILLHKAALL